MGFETVYLYLTPIFKYLLLECSKKSRRYLQPCHYKCKFVDWMVPISLVKTEPIATIMYNQEGQSNLDNITIQKSKLRGVERTKANM